MYPLGCAYPPILKHRKRFGYWDYPLSLYYGSVGLVMRRDDALAFIEWFGRLSSPPPTQFDLLLKRWHLETEPNQWWIRTPAPSFIDHLGRQSTIRRDKEHYVGRYPFAGRSFVYRRR